MEILQNALDGIKKQGIIDWCYCNRQKEPLNIEQMYWMVKNSKKYITKSLLRQLYVLIIT
ncbi:hypothetical protein AGMMS49921_08730 [Endomicrobiia bacterium]|nr:hypothetical protein AGMMS49921_08730 [Endomicrobiia bacterium]